MRSTLGPLVLSAFCACSGPSTDPISQGSSGGEGSGTSGGSAGNGASTGSGTSATGNNTGASGTNSAQSGSGTTGGSTGGASTGHASAGSMSGSSVSGSAPQSGSSGSAQSGSSGSAKSGSSGSGSSGTMLPMSGSSSGGTRDAGVMHRDAGPVVLTGCAAQVPTTVFAASCEASTCHNAKDHAYLLDLQSPGVASRLLNQPSLEALEPDGVTPYKLIDPTYPMQSYILLKTQLKMPPAGSQMPNLGTMLSPALITCLQEWVVAEAAGPY